MMWRSKATRDRIVIVQNQDGSQYRSYVYRNGTFYGPGPEVSLLKSNEWPPEMPLRSADPIGLSLFGRAAQRNQI
jgi:hypothetical protein